MINVFKTSSYKFLRLCLLLCSLTSFAHAYNPEVKNDEKVISYACPTYVLSSISATDACKRDNTSMVTLKSTNERLSADSYIVTYSLSYNGNSTSYTAPMTVSTAGIGSFIANVSIVNTTSSTNIKVKSIKSTTTSCLSLISSNNVSNVLKMIGVTVKPKITNIYATCRNYIIQWNNDSVDEYFLDVATDPSFTVFLPGYKNKAVGNIFAHEILGAVSGTTYYCRVRSKNYCGISTDSDLKSFSKIGYGWINSIAGGSASIPVGATTAAFTNATPGGTWSTVSGTGSASINNSGVVTGLSSGTVTIVYTLDNGCTTAVLKSLIIDNSIALISASGTDHQTIPPNKAIRDIKYRTTGAIGTTVTGLPPGVLGVWENNAFSISGIPTSVGVFNYRVNLTGGFGDVSTTGTITTLCEPITGIIKINQTPITTVPVTSYPFQFSTTGKTLPLEACSQTVFPLKLYAGANTLNVNSQLYTNADLRTAFTGNSLWYKNDDKVYKIDSNGKISEIYLCNTSSCQTRYLSEITVNVEPNQTIILSYTRADGRVVSESYPASSGGIQHHAFGVGACVVESSVGFDGSVVNAIYTWNDSMNCCPTPNSTEFLFSEAKNSATTVCGLTSFNNKYYASSSSIGIGTQMYLDADLRTAVGSGSMWQLLEDSGKAYQFDNYGKVAQITSCQTFPTVATTSYFVSLGGDPPSDPCAGWTDTENPCDISTEGSEKPGYVTYYTNASHTAENTEMFPGARYHFHTITPASCRSLTHYGIIRVLNAEPCSPSGN